MCWSDWLKWKEIMKAKYDFLMENKTWELISVLENRLVITGQ